MQSSALVPTSVCLSLAFVFLCLRLYARAISVTGLAGDDYLLGASFLASLAHYITHVVAHTNSFPGPYPSEDVRIAAAKAIWFSPPAWGVASALCKASIVWQYRRIFQLKWMRQSCNALLVSLVFYGLFVFLCPLLLCIPIPYIWGVGEGKCLDRQKVYFTSAALNTLLDMIIFGLPIPLIKNLMILPRGQKLGLIFVFTCGAFAIIASVFRIIAINEATSQQGPKWLSNSEGVAVWSGIEMNISIFCACLVVVRPVLAKIFPKRFGSKRSSDLFPGQASLSATSSVMRRLANRAGRFAPRERLSEDDGDVAMQTLHDVETGSKDSNRHAEQQYDKEESEGIRVHNRIDLSYKPASPNGSDSELVPDRAVWISSPGGR